MVRVIEQIGAFAGLAAFLGLALLALLSFAHGRDIRRLRDWAGSAPERDSERKEQTSTIAAQRAEELRRLEEGRTAEQQALSSREERRRRRDAGLPETSRRERLSEGFEGIRQRLAHPLYMVALFVVVLLVAGGVAYTVLNDSGDAGRKQGRQAAAKIKPGDIDVTVLNGTAVTGLASDYGDKVERKGFQLAEVGNSSSTFGASVVMFKRGHKPEAEKVANRLSITKLQLMSAEIEGVSTEASVAVIVGEDNATTAG